jgi:hypothetical protein
MSTWRRLHLNETVKAMATSDRTRFFVSVREPVGENRQPLECYRSTLSSAHETADELCRLTTRMSAMSKRAERGKSWIIKKLLITSSANGAKCNSLGQRPRMR